MVLHLSRRASNSFSRLYHLRVSISQARRLNTAGWETAGHRGGFPFSTGSKPTELTKPLLPHLLLRLLRAPPPAPCPCLFYAGDSRIVSPSSPSCHYPTPPLKGSPHSDTKRPLSLGLEPRAKEAQHSYTVPLLKITVFIN